MCEKLNINEIKSIPPEEFKEILQSWMDQKEFTQTLQKKLRKQLVTDFQRTELAKRMDAENQKNMFNSKDYVVDTLQAEHLYSQNNHFTLSVFFTETRHPTLLPNFEKEKSFRFEKTEVQQLVELLGLSKTDKITRRVLNVYNASNESLLSVLLKELISSHISTESRSVDTQTEKMRQPSLDISVISTKSKSKRSKRKKNHGLVSQEFKPKKQKKLKEVTAISQNLEKMSNNISVITKKLEEFKRNPSEDESKTIIGHVGTIMNQLNGCISNFEILCRDIKQINETRNRSYDEWMDDLQNSDNGRRFLRKLQKSFARVMNEEKSRVQQDFRKKLEREKSKLSKRYRSKSHGRKQEPANNIAMEINEIFQNTCMMMKNVEKEDELFEQSLELDHQTLMKKEKPASGLKPNPPGNNLNLNDCRLIHSAGSSSTYGSKSFERDESDVEN